ncbi:MAG TPA: polysaccharide deacetylase family protein [Pyrinomonadaceae bacterium]|jgi:peptidoglycan/xylan/chitin deacetylase (PgdA/CDA1 family)
MCLTRRVVLLVGLLAALAGVASGQARAGRRVAVTFDDLPLSQDGGRTDVATLRALTTQLLRTLGERRVPAVGFVNENKLRRGDEQAARTAVLKLWVDAGLELGNHTYSHASFYRTPLPAFKDEVLKGEETTARLLAARGQKLRYFRHPFLHTGPDLATKEAFEQFLTARGYRVAPVTIDNMEWIFAQAYAEARAAGDAATMRRVAAEYVPYMERVFEFYERLSVELFGREVPQVLLLHANALNAEHGARLLAMIERRGYRFITLDEALTDEAYRSPDNYTGPVGISWLQRWAVTRGQPFRKEPALPPYMQRFDSTSASGSDFKTGRQ